MHSIHASLSSCHCGCLQEAEQKEAALLEDLAVREQRERTLEVRSVGSLEHPAMHSMCMRDPRGITSLQCSTSPALHPPCCCRMLVASAPGHREKDSALTLSSHSSWEVRQGMRRSGSAIEYHLMGVCMQEEKAALEKRLTEAVNAKIGAAAAKANTARSATSLQSPLL